MGDELNPQDLAYQAAGAWKERALKAEATIWELEARLASLTSVSEEDVERSCRAAWESKDGAGPWGGVETRTQDRARAWTRAALTAFVSR